MLEKRKSSRVKMVLPVKISSDKVTLLAYTVDLTDTGARLGGLREQLEIGMVVSLQRGSHKAKFKIVWIRELGPKELQAGLECMEPRSNFWGVNLAARQEEAKKEMQALMTLLK